MSLEIRLESFVKLPAASLHPSVNAAPATMGPGDMSGLYHNKQIRMPAGGRGARSRLFPCSNSARLGYVYFYNSHLKDIADINGPYAKILFK